MSGVDIVRDTVPELGQTGTGTIGTTAGQLIGASDKELYSGVRIKSDIANGDNIYVGFTDGVSATKGYKLEAGQEVPIAVQKATDVYIIGGAAGMAYSWIGQ